MTYLVQPQFFLLLSQFLWLQEQTPVLDWREGAAEVLADTPAIRGFPVFVHGKTSRADRIANNELL